MKIKLISVQYPEVHFKANANDMNITSGLSMDFSNKSRFFADTPENFDIVFNLKLKNAENSFSLTIKAVAHFQTSEPIKKEFKKSHFPRINAPAIAYPFLRAFVANLVLSGGYNPIMLPTLNFQQRAEEEEQNK